MRQILAVALATALAACGTGTGLDAGAAPPISAPEPIVEQLVPTTTEPTVIVDEPGGPPSITVGGKGSAFDTPDRCVVTLGISTRRSTVAKAGNAAAHSARALVGTLTAAGVAESDIQMSEFNIYPYYGTTWEESTQLEGYQADFGYRVVLTDTESVGEILGTAIESGGDDARAWGISFETDPDGLIDIARLEAWKDAASRAAALSELIGKPLGEVLDVHEKVMMTTPSGMSQGGQGDAAPFDIPVAPGVAGVIVLLTVTYELA
ncbi:MAG: SIMPL domain-containing protein [Acidimicrobiia bacterium]